MVSRVVLSCPACRSNLIVPLSLPEYRRPAGPEVNLRRPVAKCSRCGARIFAEILTRQRLPKAR
jgi:DNA-directed RNA polymerase subunit RPC12/RpoP